MDPSLQYCSAVFVNKAMGFAFSLSSTHEKFDKSFGTDTWLSLIDIINHLKNIPLSLVHNLKLNDNFKTVII